MSESVIVARGGTDPAALRLTLGWCIPYLTCWKVCCRVDCIPKLFLVDAGPVMVTPSMSRVRPEVTYGFSPRKLALSLLYIYFLWLVSYSSSTIISMSKSLLNVLYDILT